jgi:hypothetical protein
MAGNIIHVSGAEKLALVGTAMRRLGAERVIVKEMSKRIRRLAGPFRDAVKTSARSTLPHHGGLGEWVARSRMITSVRTTTRSAGVRLVARRTSLRGASDIARIDAGRVRHPLFGDRAHWYAEAVTAGFGTRVLDGPVADEFRQEIGAAVDDAIAEVLRGI